MTTCSIRDFGAVGDGRSNDAAAIQAAIDHVTAAGGGTVVVPAGHTFLTGSIELKDNVDLHLEPGSILDGSPDPAAYTFRLRVSALSSGEFNDSSEEAFALVGARHARRVAITGSGTIRGGGRHFIQFDTGHIYRCPNSRPFTVFLIGCQDVLIRDTTFTDAGLWCLRLTGVDRALVDGVRIDNDLKYPNADGIDLDRCRQVRVSNCEISTGDDAISLKTSEEFPGLGPTEDIVIANCTLQSTSSAVVVGVDAVDAIRNVVVANCVVRSSHRGLSVNLGQAGSFENILFSDCIVETRHFHHDWWGNAEPIYVSAFPWHGETVGTIRNVRFRNILARAETGVFVSAERASLIDGVHLDGVRIELDRWSSWPGGTYDRRPYDTGAEIYPSPISGFHIDAATNVTLRHCEVAWAQPAGQRSHEFGAALEAIDAPGLVIHDLTGEPAQRDGQRVIERRRA